MMKTYGFFKPHQKIEISADDNVTVKELIKELFKKYGWEAKNGYDVITVYDMNKYHVVTNTESTLKNEDLSKSLCLAYFKKNEFLYVEGGWGHHMIKMDAVKEIENPFQFYMSFKLPLNDYAFVANKDFSVEKLYNSLVTCEYIHNCSYIDIYKINRGGAKFELVKRVLASEAIEKGLTVLDLMGEENLSSYTIMFSK